MDWKNKREELDFSQQDVAKLLGVSVEDVQRWENGDAPTPEQERMLRILFKCDASSEDNTHKPISCPHCKSQNLAYVAEIHKCLSLKILATIFLILAILIFIPAIKEPDGQGPLVAVFLIFATIFYIGAIVGESRSHVKCVCKDCGHTWLHD